MQRQLTPDEFQRLHAGEKPYYEYLFGEAVQKKAATLTHGLMQMILALRLDQAGYRSALEVEIRIDPEWRPIPDVIALSVPIKSKYPTQPTDIVAEILSHDDTMFEIFRRCKQYERLQFKKIFIVDPEALRAWEWDASLDNLERVQELRLPNGSSIPVSELWEELTRAVN